MKKIIYILLLSVLPLTMTAQENNPTVDSTTTVSAYTKAIGDSAYSKGDYNKAIEVYESIIADKGSSLQLYYNLGNAYFRSNMLGKSILNFERALRIDPTDEDTKANLEFAQSRMKDEIPEQYEIFFVSWFKAIVNMCSITTWSVTGIVAFIVLLLALLIILFNKNAGRRKFSVAVTLVSLFVTIFANISAYNLNCTMQDDSHAIVMKEETSLKSTPNNSGTVLIKVHEGRKVKIADDNINEWKKIELEDGTVGWVPSSVIERI